MQELLAFKTFATREDADLTAGILRDGGIVAEVATQNPGLGSVYLGESYADKYMVRIQGIDFEKGNELLLAARKVVAEQVDDNDPLATMTNEELKQVIAAPDEWGLDNYSIAIALLARRGVPVSDEILSSLKESRINDLSEKKDISPYYLVLGYAASLMHIVFIIVKYQSQKEYEWVWYFPGFFGIFLAAVILQSKTTLPDGRRVVTYNSRVVKHGLWLLAINIVAIIVNVLIYVFVFA